MYKKSNGGKVSQWVFLILLLCVSKITFGFDKANWKSDTFSLGKEGEVSLPVRIAPVLVETPPRHVDLLLDNTKQRSIDDAWSETHDVSLQLAGFPVDLYEFPVLKYSAINSGFGPYGIELALDTRDKGTVDTLVRIGEPSLFPDMVYERIDFQTAVIVARDLGYRIKRALDIGGDEKWRYMALNAKVGDIADGIVNASFEPGSSLVLQRAFASLELSKTPWLRYEYELPEGLPWVVQINAKIDGEGLSPKLITLFSEPVRGGGKQKILVNLLDLLQKADPAAKDGRLEELIIHFKLDETAGIASQNVRIGLGRLELYYAQMLAQANGPDILLTEDEGGKDSNLLEMLERRLGSKDTLAVLDGRLVSARRDLASVTEDVPKISLRAEYREKIPELFVSEPFFLNELSGNELSAVLDQQMFVEKNIIWESGQSDVIFIKQVEFNPGQEGLALPLVSYSLDARIEDNAYIKADYSFEGGAPFPLYLTLSGIDKYGRQVEFDRLLLNNRPLKVKDIRIRKITVSFRQEARAAVPPNTSCVIRKIEINSFKKTEAYRPKPAMVNVALNRGEDVSSDNTIWHADPARFVINLRDGEDFQTVQTFPVEAKIVGDAAVKFDFVPASGRNLAYILRVRGSDERGEVEKLFPMNRSGEVRLSNIVLHSLDIAVIGDGGPSSAAVLLNKLDIQYINNKVSGKQHEPSQPKASAPGGIIYHAPHLTLTASLSQQLISTLAAELMRPDTEGMIKLDATLSYNQIIEGGKIVFLPKTFLYRGEHKVDFVVDAGVSVAIDQSLLPLNSDQQVRGSMKENAEEAALSKMAKIVLLILAGVIIWLGVKSLSKWLPLVDGTLSLWMVFWGVQLVLLIASLFLIFSSATKDAIFWGGLLLVFAYGLAVHYKIRPYLAKKWTFFSERRSAPYFLLFLALLLSCAVMLMFKLNMSAEHTAAIGYYLLVIGVAVEFISFAKEARLDTKLPTK
jgi:hypothetical protein